MSGDEPRLEWQRGSSLGQHPAVSIVAVWHINARDEYCFVTVDVLDPEQYSAPLLHWQDDLTTNLNNSDGLLDQIEEAITGAMGYLTPVV